MMLLHRLFFPVVFLFPFFSFPLVSANEPVVVGNIFITGNKVTQESIILRELEFSKGDTLPAAQLEALIGQSRKNLLNLPLFHFVTITFSEN